MNRAPRILVIQHNLDDHLNELAVPLMQAGIDIVPWDVEHQAAPTEPLENFDGAGRYLAPAGTIETQFQLSRFEPAALAAIDQLLAKVK